MKVVLFCGGYGMRMRSSAEDHLPKPLQLVGNRPLLWHLMKYYAYHGHKDFILCLGYGAEAIKRFFLDYDETASNDFIYDQGTITTLSSDIADWRITFVDTGLKSAIGERLRRVRPYLDGDETFLANYADVLTDADLNELIAEHTASGAKASMLLVPPQQSFHTVDIDGDSRVTDIGPVADADIWENGGFFVLTQAVFDHIPQGGDLVADGCAALAERRELHGMQYKGYWCAADTFKERAELDEIYRRGRAPWQVWSTPEDEL